jgi:chemotaxis protein MotB
MEKTGPDIIIIRRKSGRTADMPKGGVWKIAHADFMTAMMALFLVLWLVNSTNRETRAEVAQYFNPIKLSNTTQDRKGVRDPQASSPGEINGAPATEGRVKDGKSPDATNPASERSTSAKLKPQQGQGTAPFEDPYAVLAEATSIKPEPGSGSAATLGSAGKPGLQGGEALRDPFDPNFWRQAPQVDRQAQPEAKAAATKTLSATAADPVPASAAARPQTGAEAAAKPAQNAAGAGEAQAALAGSAPGQPSTAAATLARQQADAAVASAIASAIGTGKEGSQRRDAPQVDVRQTDEGVLISLTDNVNFGMFAIGSAEPHAETVNVMQRIATVLNKREGAIIIRGHTDARPFRSGNGDNWRLSTARAHTAQDLLIRGGIDEARIEHVEGYASRKPRAGDPAAAENRRIEILVREKRT